MGVLAAPTWATPAAEPAAPRLGRNRSDVGVGNQASLRRLQAKLTIGAVDDPLEHEADAAAEQVMRTPDPALDLTAAPPRISRKCAACEDEATLQAKNAGGDMGGDEAPAAVDNALREPGRPLDAETRAFFEPRFGADFSDVRVHTGEAAAKSARSVGALGYTVGRDIVFDHGRYAPEGDQGRRLLAHELTHTLQQDGAVRRDTPSDPDASGGARTGDDAGAAAGGDGAGGKDVTEVYGRVERILVSCEQERVALKTGNATYIYTLSQCDRHIPAADYEADVTVDEKTDNVGLKLHMPGGKHLFRGQFVYKRGQPNPATLLKDQDSVTVGYGAHVDISPIDRLRPHSECPITIEPQTLFSPGAKKVDLTDHLPKIPKFKWTLAEFGLADVVLRLGIEATASAGYSYDAGKLDNICLTPTARHPLGGHAQFNFAGRADLHLDVTVAAEAKVEALGLFDILSAHGALKLDIDAATGGDIKALVEIEANPADLKSFKLKTDVELVALAALEAKVSGSAGIDFLGYSLWEGHSPEMFKSALSYGWTGGLVFDNSFIPRPKLGTFAKASPAQLQAGALRTGGPRRLAKDDDTIPVKELVESWIHDSSGELTADGSSCEKALPLHWFKPRDISPALYPKVLGFQAPGVYPTQVERDGKPVQVSHHSVPTTVWERGKPVPGDPITGPTWIGVADDNWPESGGWAKCFEYAEGKSSREESAALRQLLTGLDTRYDGTARAEGNVQVDHVRELQFGGEDQFHNLWPLDASANQSAGSLHQKQIEAYRKMLHGVDGRHFKIAGIGLDPEKAAKIGGS